MSSSLGVNVWLFLTDGPVGSTYHGGIAPATRFSRMDSAQAAAPPASMLYFSSDMGAGPPSAWHRPHLSRRIGYTSSLYVNFDVIPLCASIVAVAITATATAAAPETRAVATCRFVLLSIGRLQVANCRGQSLIRFGDFLAVTEVAVGVEFPRRRDDAFHGIGHRDALTFRQRVRVCLEHERNGLGRRCRQPDLRQISFVHQLLDITGTLAEFREELRRSAWE